MKKILKILTVLFLIAGITLIMVVLLKVAGLVKPIPLLSSTGYIITTGFAFLLFSLGFHNFKILKRYGDESEVFTYYTAKVSIIAGVVIILLELYVYFLLTPPG